MFQVCFGICRSTHVSKQTFSTLCERAVLKYSLCRHLNLQAWPFYKQFRNALHFMNYWPGQTKHIGHWIRVMHWVENPLWWLCRCRGNCDKASVLGWPVSLKQHLIPYNGRLFAISVWKWAVHLVQLKSEGCMEITQCDGVRAFGMHNGVVVNDKDTGSIHSTVLQTRPWLKEKKQRDKDQGRRRHDTTPQPRAVALTTRNEEEGRSRRRRVWTWRGFREGAGSVRFAAKRSHGRQTGSVFEGPNWGQDLHMCLNTCVCSCTRVRVCHTTR